jgi:hypothetical protein
MFCRWRSEELDAAGYDFSPALFAAVDLGLDLTVPQASFNENLSLLF